MNRTEAFARLKALFSSLPLSQEDPAIGLFRFDERHSWYESVLDESISYKAGVDDEYRLQEEVFLASVPCLPDLAGLKLALGSALTAIAKPSRQHAHTLVTLLYVVDETNGAEREAIKRFRCSKSFLLTFHGRAETALVVWDMETHSFLANRLGQRFVKAHGTTLAHEKAA